MLEEIRAKRENKASTIISKTFMNTLKPHLEETTYKSFFKYTIPKTILKRLPTINIGKLNAVPEIVMSSTIYNLLRKVLIQKIKELKFLRIFLSFELMLNKSDVT